MTPERLKAWRTGRNLSQERAAKECRVSRRAWIKWEAGETKPPAWLGLVLAAVMYGKDPYE